MHPLSGFYRIILISGMALQSAPMQNAITIHVLDGKNGKPVSGEHVIVAQGSSPEEVRLQKNHYDLHTNQQGIAILHVDNMLDSRIQVWVDFHVLCQKSPNFESFSVREIVQTGVSTANSCGSVAVESGPRKLFVFVRKPTFREKLRR